MPKHLRMRAKHEYQYQNTQLTALQQAPKAKGWQSTQVQCAVERERERERERKRERERETSLDVTNTYKYQ